MNSTDKEEIFPYHIRDLTTNDIDQYNALLRYAFQVTEQDLINAGWQGDEIKQSKFPVLERADILGCYDGETLVSQFAVYPLNMNIYNEIYSIGFITSVSTYPEYSGKGIMSRLMKKSLIRMREKDNRWRCYTRIPFHYIGNLGGKLYLTRFLTALRTGKYLQNQKPREAFTV